ncbi:uncharacterized protein [Montipora capricornis]|uniref:uncharacterized protein n=1 Tax=Montipora capricornis TaxID=246305 RepID=UPI0035F1E3E5
MELWKEASPDNSFEFHPYATYAIEEESPRRTDDGGDGQNDSKGDEQIVRTSTKGFLFVHQTRDQKRLLERYGNEICMLDATYKTTRYSLPLFRDVVKTNVDYQIVGSFVVQSETADAIFEALMVLKSWNPPCVMVDYSGEQMSAIERLYADVQIVICDFHREQAWERWLARASNGLTVDKHNVLAKLRSVARARTEKEYMDKLEELKDSEEWKSSSNLQNYMTKTWLPQKWVWAFRKDRFLTTTNTNNGVKRQNKAFKYDYLEGHNHATLSRRLTVVVEDFLPNKYLSCVPIRQRMPCKHFFAVFLHVPAWSFDRPPKPYRDSPFLR